MHRNLKLLFKLRLLIFQQLHCNPCYFAPKKSPLEHMYPFQITCYSDSRHPDSSKCSSSVLKLPNLFPKSIKLRVKRSSQNEVAQYFEYLEHGMIIKFRAAGRPLGTGAPELTHEAYQCYIGFFTVTGFFNIFNKIHKSKKAKNYCWMMKEVY